MRTHRFQSIIAVLALSLLPACTTRVSIGDNESKMQIKDQTLTVQIADSDTERIQGLSGREPLPDNHAMLFIFPQPVQGSFWMKDMQFSLDVIWIKDNQVVDIDKNIPPPSQTNNLPEVIHPAMEYTHAVEIKGGWADQHNIQIGDLVTLPR